MGIKSWVLIVRHFETRPPSFLFSCSKCTLSPIGSSRQSLLHYRVVTRRVILGLTLFHYYELAIEAQCYFYPWLFIVEQSCKMCPVPLWRTLAWLISACPTVQCNQRSWDVKVGQMGAITALEMDLSAYRLACSPHPFLFYFLQPMRKGAKPFTQTLWLIFISAFFSQTIASFLYSLTDKRPIWKCKC